jgi:hypothetical protein
LWGGPQRCPGRYVDGGQFGTGGYCDHCVVDGGGGAAGDADSGHVAEHDIARPAFLAGDSVNATQPWWCYGRRGESLRDDDGVLAVSEQAVAGIQSPAFVAGGGVNAGPDGLIAENSSSTMSIRRGSFVVVVRPEVPAPRSGGGSMITALTTTPAAAHTAAAAIVVPVLARRLPAAH